MKDALSRYIIGEFAETIDESFLPQTTISSLGLRLAVKLYPIFKAASFKGDSMPKDRLFASALEEFLISELNYTADIKFLSKDRFRFSVKVCPFQEYKSQTLCSVMQGIVGGLILMSFGYCKFVTLSGPDRMPKSCIIDMFTAPTDEATSKYGIEYSKKTIALLQGADDKTIAMQRQMRRKLALGLFSSMTISSREDSSEGFLVQKYIEALSCIPEIKVAALYLKENHGGRYILTGYYGLSEEVVPAIRTIGTEDNIDGAYDENLLEAIEEFDTHKEAIRKKLSIHSFSSIRLKVQDKIIGVLNIGWKTSFPISVELRNAISDSCALLATVIDNNRLYLELETSHLKLEKSYVDNITLINNLVGVVDIFLGNHSRRVADVAEAIAIKMGLPQEEITLLYHAALVHDIGKVNIRPEILNKTGQLTEIEFEIVKEHPRIGADLVSPVPMFNEIVPAILYHHERLDGSGYPEGLQGDKIPLYARIIAVADTFDAMTHQRAYREALSEEEAIDRLVNESGIKYDIEVVKALIASLRDKRVACTDLLHPA